MAASPSTKKMKEEIPPDVQNTVDEIDNLQTDIDSLNEQAAEEILRIEQRYSKLRQPFYEKRGELLKKIPEFWFTTFMNHPKLSVFISGEDEPCLQHLVDVRVKDAENIHEGYYITFEFSPNPYFENATLTKSFDVGEDGIPNCAASTICWKEGQNLTETSSQSNGKRKLKEDSFFIWFLDTDAAANDDIAEIIKDDIWLNPLRYFLLPKVEVDSDDDENDEDNKDEDEDEENDDIDG